MIRHGRSVGRLTIAATPGRIIDDQRPHVTVAGLVPNATVIVTASVTDAAKTAWTSTARFKADDGDRLDLDRTRRCGSYQGVDGGGLLWSMTPGSGQQNAMLAVPVAGDQDVVFTAVSGGRSPSATVVRTVAPAIVREHSLMVAADGLYGVYAASSAPAATPRAGGRRLGQLRRRPVHDGRRRTPRRPRHSGAGTGIFCRPGLPTRLSDIPIEYFEKVAWVGRQPGVDPRRIIVAASPEAAKPRCSPARTTPGSRSDLDRRQRVGRLRPARM